MRKTLLVLLYSIFPVCVCADEVNDLALVSIAKENKVSVFELNKEKNELNHVGDFKVNGDAGSQYFDKRRSLLYLGLRNAGKIAILKLNREQKTLSLLDEVDVDKDPAYLRVDRTGKWLFAAYYATGRISCFGLDSKGTFQRESKSEKNKKPALKKPRWFKTAPRAHAIVEDATNQFVFVPHTGPNCIFQFRFNDSTGELTPNSNQKVQFKQGLGPRHIVNHPKNASLWFAVNEQGSSVTALTMDKKRGSLAWGTTISTLPDSFTDRNACSDIEFTRDGRFLFAANRGHDSIAVFQVKLDGKFFRTGIFKTAKTPRQFGLSADDRFLIAAGQGADQLVLFQIDSTMGKLKQVQSVPTGKMPWWISVVD